MRCTTGVLSTSCGTPTPVLTTHNKLLYVFIVVYAFETTNCANKNYRHLMPIFGSFCNYQLNMRQSTISVVFIFYLCFLGINVVDSLAAGKKGKKASVVGKGFGPKQPSLQEIVDKFPNRIPANAEECDCPCSSGKKYVDCCSVFHRKEKLPGSPMDVLRSRYTAFAVSDNFVAQVFS